MEEVITALLQQENITSILSTSTVSYLDLNHFEIRYVKDNNYYTAGSFFTHMWAAKTPAGPKIMQDNTLKMASFKDIANIHVFEDASQWKSQRPIQREHLKLLYTKLKEDAKEYALNVLANSYMKDLFYRVDFTLTPLPTILVSLMKKNVFLGCIAMPMSGPIYSVTKTSIVVDSLVEILNLNHGGKLYDKLASAAGQLEAGRIS